MRDGCTATPKTSWPNTDEAVIVTEANEAEIFPILTSEQIARIAPFAQTTILQADTREL